jgi:hypothetical protein
MIISNGLYTSRRSVVFRFLPLHSLSLLPAFIVPLPEDYRYWLTLVLFTRTI